MKKYCLEYLKEIDSLLKGNIKEKEKLINEHLIKINFFNQERLIHLLVTLAYGIVVIVGFLLALAVNNILLFLIPLMLMFFLIPYIFHYFLLENSVHKMYKQYDEMLKK